ncbi:MAG: hypothetical protein U9R08_03835 [Nanoarchaeota archaeon]|nr:hypothetical protein [Nanoarchaeota archaeon]
MYSSNNSITPASYSHLESSIYAGFDSQVFMPKYHGMHRQQDFYQTTDHNEDDKKYESLKPKKPEENKDVVVVDDMAFDLFLRFSPLLKSLESKEVKQLYADFLKDKGKHLLKFLKDKKRRFIDLVGFARMKLESNAIAAVVRSGDRAILAVNMDFNEKVYDFSRHNCISIKEALEYVFAHETVHLADEMSEKATETLVGEFYKERNETLSKVAYRRAAEIN